VVSRFVDCIIADRGLTLSHYFRNPGLDHLRSLRHATAEHPDGIPLTVPPQPEHLRNASVHFLAAIEDPAMPIHPLCDADHGCNAQWILEEGIRATA